MANINKNIIMQAGAAVANATNKAAGLSASTPEPGAIISAIQLVNGGREIGPAALAHFTESVRNKLLSLLVSMEPIQDFNGYGHPWPAGGGANLLNVNNPLTFTRLVDIPLPRVFEDGTTLYIYRKSYTYTVEPSSGSKYPYVVLRDSRTSTNRNGVWVNPNSTKTNITASGDFDTIRLWSNGNSSSDSTGVEVTIDDLVIGTVEVDSYSPYSNICPITGRTGMDVYAGPTDSIGDAATYSMDWTSPAGTVYAGSADIVTGDIKAAPYYESYNGETLVGPWVSSMDAYDPEGTPTTGAQVVDLGGTMSEYHITGQDIITLVGDNYIWSDSGDVTITE